MSNQQIDELETRLWLAKTRINQKHQPLRNQLKQLLEELKNTWRSSRKLEIMNKMTEIEQQIKKDNETLKRIRESIELIKSQWRKEQLQMDNLHYQAMASVYKTTDSSIRVILQELEAEMM